MKFELTKDDTDDIAYALENNNTRGWLQMKSELVFEIGDVLIKLFKRTERSTNSVKWVTENIQSDTKMPQRYVYVHEDENGIGFIKPLRVSDGTLGKDLLCLTDFDYRDTRFQVDPEYAEHMLLDAEFDIKEIRKRANEGRQLVIKANRKIGFKPKDLAEWNTFVQSLKVGDKFFLSDDYTGRFIQECTFISKKKASFADLEKDCNWSWRNFRDKMKKKSIPIGGDGSYHVKYDRSMGGNHSKRDDYTFNWYGRVAFKIKPKDARENETN